MGVKICNSMITVDHFLSCVQWVHLDDPKKTSKFITMFRDGRL